MVSDIAGLVCWDEFLIVGGGDIILGRGLGLRLNLRLRFPRSLIFIHTSSGIRDLGVQFLMVLSVDGEIVIREGLEVDFPLWRPVRTGLNWKLPVKKRKVMVGIQKFGHKGN